MGSLDDENIHAKRERLIVELVRGKETAIQLQTLLDKPVKDHGPVSAEDLALQIFRSFTDSLSVLGSCDESTGPAQISAVDGGISASSKESKKKPAVKNRRGCYKRRTTSDSRMIISPLLGDDGYAWRKYGQKNILNKEFPRCYFRCTHKYQGCKATKQVQRIEKDPILYQITYFNRHTCAETPVRTRPPLDDQPNLLSFRSRKDGQPTSPVIMTAPLKEEPRDAESEGDSDAKSSLDEAWREIVGTECFGYDDLWTSTMSIYPEEGASCSGSAGLHGLDMDDINDELADIGTFHFDELY